MSSENRFTRFGIMLQRPGCRSVDRR